MDLNKHKFFMLQILRDIYSDLELSNCLGFKGGTALMFFYNLPRFSVDLDFNLLVAGRETAVYQKVRNILLKYGTIDDEAQKFFGPILVLNYGKGERKLKVEISNRQYDNHYEVKTFMENRTPINKDLVESRMKMPFTDYLQNCIDTLSNLSDKNLLNGIGDLVDDKMKHFIRTKLCNETIMLLRFYKEYPIC